MNCQDYQRHYYKYLHDRQHVAGEVCAHIETCENCQKEVSRLKNELQVSNAPGAEFNAMIRRHLSLHASLENQWIGCERIRPFLPAMLVDFLHVSQETSVTEHVRQCGKCRQHLEQIRTLKLSANELTAAARYLAGEKDLSEISNETKELLEQINNCEESGVETRMNTAKLSDADGLSSRRSAAQVRYRRDGNNAVRARSTKYLLAGGISIAAIIMLVVLPTSVSGLNLQTLNKTVKAAPNVHIELFSGEGQQIQEIWLSRPLGFKLYKQSQKSLFKDLQTGRIVQKQTNGEMVNLNDGSREEEPYARIMPFEHLRDLPAKYDWSYKGDWQAENGKDLRIYELAWDYSGSGIVVNKIWRAYLDPDSHLPYVIEWLERLPGQEEFSLITISRIDYPTQATCSDLLTREGFQRFLRFDQAE